MHLRKQKGFTLIELVLVIVILGILAIAALPSFVDISSNAAQSSRDGVVGAIRSGVGIYRSNNLVNVGPPGCFPTTLGGSAGAASLSNRLFSTVINNGIDDSSWVMSTSTSFYYNKGNVSTTYTYAPSTGLFTSS